MAIRFSLNYTHKGARSGILHTAHGEIETPVFMPVGTCATVKAMTNDSLENIGSQIILANTYHLMLRPSEDSIEKMGGLHKFMNWNKPILTDSGGFQVMSLSKISKVKEDGVEFKSHIDGRSYFVSPEKSIEIQRKLGSTITMAFDECIPYPATYQRAKDAMELSMRWAKRSKDAFEKRDGYGLFGIMQGSTFEDLRRISAKILTDIDFDGYALGGLAVGEPQKEMFEVLDYACDLLPTNKPRYLMGVGKPSDLVGAVKRGIDMFDCVLPTRSGRNGQVFTKDGPINIKNAKFILNDKPIDDSCDCYTCKNHSLGYLNHLFRSKEILSAILLTTHNLRYYHNLMTKLRYYIKNKMDIDFVQ
jgi:queuine tRNA-ribosyltransferase